MIRLAITLAGAVAVCVGLMLFDWRAGIVGLGLLLWIDAQMRDKS